MEKIRDLLDGRYPHPGELLLFVYCACCCHSDQGEPAYTREQEQSTVCQGQRQLSLTVSS